MADLPPFAKAITRTVLIFDGAMGTEIYRRDVLTDRCFDELCLSNPDLIRAIHSDYCNATFLQNEIPGVTVPEEVMDRMAAHESREDQRRTGIEIAREAVEEVRNRVARIQVSAPFGNIHTALAVIQ